MMNDELGMMNPEGKPPSTVSSFLLHPSSLTLLLLGLCVCLAGNALAFEPESTLSLPENTKQAIQNAASLADNNGAPVIPNAGSTIYDTTPPVPGTAQAASHANAAPVTVSYANAADEGGSTLQEVRLWVKFGVTGAWTETTLTGAGPAGNFLYTPDLGDGVYHFALKAVDKAGNTSPDPTGGGDAQLIYDTVKPVITLVGGNVTLEFGSAYTDPGAAASDAQDGDLTSRIVTLNPVNTSMPAVYTVTYNVRDTAGNAALEVHRAVTVLTAPSYAIAVLQPDHGSILTNPAPGPDGKFAGGTPVTFTYTPDATSRYDLSTWSGAQQDANDPKIARLTVNGAVTVSAVLARQTGSVSVSVTPDTATWTVTDGDQQTRKGTGDQVLTGIPTGTVSIVYDPISGSTTPASQSASLAKGGTVPFSGSYVMANAVLVSVPENLSGAPGATVECPIEVNNAEGLTGYSLRVSFDSSLVECTSVAAGSVAGAWNAPVSSVNAGSVSVSASGSALPSGGGKLAVLRLRIKEGATSPTGTPITLSHVTVTPAGASISTADGNLTIEEGKFLWGDVDGDKTVDVLDADLLLKHKVGLVDPLPNAALDPNSFGGADVSGDSPPMAGTVDASLILKKSAGLIAKFPADGNGDGMGPEPSGASTADSVAAALIAQLAQATTRVISTAGTVALEPSATVVVPVSLDNANALQGYSFSLTYDSSRLDFVSINKGSLTAEWNEPTFSRQPDLIVVAGAGVKPLSGSGSLAVVGFRVLAATPAGSSTEITLSDADLNDGAVPVEIRAAEGEPVLESITPATGATMGGTVVALKGTNLSFVSNVTFGSAPSPWFQISADTSTLQAITPGGGGVVDVTVESPNGSDTLPGAFTYFTPDVYLEMNPADEVFAGSPLDIPVSLATPTSGTPAGITFTLQFDPKLFAVKVGGETEEVVTIGTAVTQAGKSVISLEPRPGRLTVTIGSVSGTGGAIPQGELCTLHLLAIGSASNTNGLLYVSNVTATPTAGTKSLRTAASVATTKAATAP